MILHTLGQARYLCLVQVHHQSNCWGVSVVDFTVNSEGAKRVLAANSEGAKRVLAANSVGSVVVADFVP